MTNFIFKDPTDYMAGGSLYREERSKKPAGIVLHFRHVPSGVTAEFKAFLTAFGDAFTTQWNSQEIYGRMDEVKTFKNTQRKINVAWTVPSHSEDEAIDNFSEISKMAAMQYPLYEDLKSNPDNEKIPNTSNVILDLEQIKQNLLSINRTAEDTLNEQTLNDVGAIRSSIKRVEDAILESQQDSGQDFLPNQQVSLLSSPPIIQMKFMNWISDSNDDGLYGTMEGFTFSPMIDDGMFIRDGKLIAMSYECSVDFTVIHTDKLGWNREKTKRTDTFPYQANKVKVGIDV